MTNDWAQETYRGMEEEVAGALAEIDAMIAAPGVTDWETIRITMGFLAPIAAKLAGVVPFHAAVSDRPIAA